MAAIRILIVEDEMLVATRIKDILETAGYEVFGMSDTGEGAINQVGIEIPDIIIMDIKLAGEMDGIIAAGKIRTNFNIPVIILTDFDDKVTLKRVERLNPECYLLKPFTERQLVVSIHHSLYNAHHKYSPKPDERQEISEGDYLISDALFILDKGGYYTKVSLSEILYIQANRAYSIVHLASGKSITQSKSMGALHESIKLPYFLRANRFNVINLHKVDAIKGNALIVGSKSIPLGKKYQDKVIKHLQILGK